MMRFRLFLLIPALCVSVAGPSWAFTQAEIDQAAIVAGQIDIVSVIASSTYLGRNNNTAESAAIRAILIDELSLVADGLNAAETGDAAYEQAFSTTATGTNVLGVIPGLDLAAEYVMIGAHYDGLGFSGATIFNGATDNAAGVAAVLAIGAAIQALPTPPRRSIILALWDAQKDGEVGSLAYADSPLVPLASTVAYINLDILGANLVPSLRSTTFAVGAESGGTMLQAMVEDAAMQQSLDTAQLSRLFGQERSDHVVFMDPNRAVPTVFLSDGTGSCYETPGDEISVVNLEKLAEQSQLTFRLALALAEVSVPPAFVPTSVLDGTYADAVVVIDILDQALVDIDLFDPPTQTELLGNRDAVRAVVDAGSGSFDEDALATVVIAAFVALNSLQELDCNGFLENPQAIPLLPAIPRVILVVLLIGSGSLALARRG